MIPPSQSFTVEHDGLADVLITKVAVFPAFNPETAKPPKNAKKYNAIWDTGATGTCITKKIARECGLEPISMTKVSTASGVMDAYVYLVALGLPHGIGIPQIKVTEANLSSDIDLLIGMDIIGSGDFAVTNLNGKTVFSFRSPSLACIDFVQESNGLKNLFPYLGIAKNSACPCGSRRKFKNCHGKIQE